MSFAGAGAVRAVLFDAAGTLFEVYPSVGERYAMEAARFGVKVSPERVARCFARVWRSRHSDGSTHAHFHTSEAVERAWWRDLVREVFEEAAPGSRFEPSFDACFDRLFELFASPDAWRLFEDSRPAIDALLGAGLRLAVVSNFDSRLPRLLRAMDLTPQFEFILTSAEAGVRKPDRFVFEAALPRLELPAEAVAHIGDSLEDDALAARTAGLQAILLDRRERHARTAAQNGLTRVRSLAEAAALITDGASGQPGAPE